MNQHLRFGPFDVIRLAECPDVAFLWVQSNIDEIVIAKSELSDLRRALDWLESEWGGGVEQPRLPLGPTCATCRRFMGAYEGYRGKTYGLCHADMFELQDVPADGSGGCEKHEPKGASDGQ